MDFLFPCLRPSLLNPFHLITNRSSASSAAEGDHRHLSYETNLPSESSHSHSQSTMLIRCEERRRLRLKGDWGRLIDDGRRLAPAARTDL